MYIRSIQNTGKLADQLISARTPVAERVELHQMQMDNNVMKMRAVPAIELPAQAELRMMHGSADGYHLMLINLKQPLKDGDRFSVWLQFKNSGEREVTVHVQTPKHSAPAHDHPH
jgi:copper(I)-binding protein